MKKILISAAVALFSATQAFAIAGIGAHYVMNTGSLRASSGSNPVDGTHSINVNQAKADGLQGLGFKAWIDFLPFVDIEGTFNVAATRYKTTLEIPAPTEGDPNATKEIPLSYSPDAPYNMIFDNADPLYGLVSGDLSVTYPLDFLPIIRPYIGAGLTYFASIPIVNADFTKKMIDNAPELVSTLKKDLEEGKDPTGAADAIGKALVKTLKDESYKTGIGGHAIIGVRIKPPVIPLAIYANGKYYFGGNLDSQFSNGFVVELGGGFAL